MDSNFTTTEPSATSLVNSAMQRLAGQSSACKLCGAALGAVVLLFAAGRSGGESLLWATAPVGLLALADAGYVAARRRLVKSGAGSADSARNVLQCQAVDGGFEEVGNLLAGFFSLSVWPFYLALGGLVGGLGVTVMTGKPQMGPVPAGYPQQIQFAGNMGQPGTAGPPSVSRPYPGGVPGGYPPSIKPGTVENAAQGPLVTSRFPNSPGNRPFPAPSNSPRNGAPGQVNPAASKSSPPPVRPQVSGAQNAKTPPAPVSGSGAANQATPPSGQPQTK